MPMRLDRFSTTLTKRQALPHNLTQVRQPVWLFDQTAQYGVSNGLGVRPWANNRFFPEGPIDPPDEPVLPPTANGVIAPWALLQSNGLISRGVAPGFFGAVNSYAIVTPVPGVSINSVSGVLTADTAVVALGTTSISVQAINTAGSATQTFNINVTATLQPPVTVGTLAAWTVTKGTTGNTYNTARGFSGSTLAYAIQGTPIAGLTINAANGLLTADSNVVPVGARTVTVRATNAAGFAEQTVSLTIVTLLPAPVAVGTLSPWAVTIGTGIVTKETASGFSGTVTSYSLTGNPAGVTINTPTGIISADTASMTAATSAMTVTASNASGFATQALSLVASAALQPPVAVGTLASIGYTKDTGGYTYATAGGFSGANIVYSIFSGAVSGISINPATGVITVDTNAVAASGYPLTIRATNSAGFAAQNLAITVMAGLAKPVKVGQLADWTVTEDTGVKTYATASGFSGTIASYALVSPPAGMSIVAATGIISCNTALTPVGAVSLTVRASNASGSADQVFTLNVNATVVVLPKAVTLTDNDFDMLGTMYDPAYPSPSTLQTGVISISPTSQAFNSTILKWGQSTDVPQPLVYIGLDSGGEKLYRMNSSDGRHMKLPNEFIGGVHVYHQTPATSLSDPSDITARFTVPLVADLPLLAQIKPI